MSDDDPAVDGETGSEACTEQAAELVERRKHRLLRLAALIIIPLLLVLAVIGVWLFGDGILADQIRQAIHRAGLDPGETRVEASALGGRVALLDADLVDTYESERRTVYRSPETVVDVAVLDTLIAGAPIIDRIAMREAMIDLRRFPDGSVPGMPEDPEAEDDPDAPEEQPPRDLVELYRKWKERIEKAREWLPERDPDEEVDEEVADQPVRPAEGWERAVRFFPIPDEDDASPFPRTLVRELDISGEGIVLPDSQPDSPSPLDVAAFALQGTNVTTRIEGDEVMDLGGSYQTVGAGTGTFGYQGRTDSGGFTWAWEGIPLPTVAEPSVSGEHLTDYHPGGSARLALDAEWQGEELGGAIVLELIDLTLQPTAEAGPEAGELARGLDELRELHAKLDAEGPLVIRWTLTLGGTPSEPRITDLGAASFKRALADTARQLKVAATAKAKAVAKDAKDAAVEEGKGLIKDLQEGGDPEDSAKDRLKNLEDKGEGLKGLFGR